MWLLWMFEDVIYDLFSMVLLIGGAITALALILWFALRKPSGRGGIFDPSIAIKKCQKDWFDLTNEKIGYSGMIGKKREYKMDEKRTYTFIGIKFDRIEGSKVGLPILFIYCFNDGTIWGYKDNLSPLDRIDPLHDFEPAKRYDEVRYTKKGPVVQFVGGKNKGFASEDKEEGPPKVKKK